MSTKKKEREELTKIGPFLCIIAALYTVHRDGVEVVEESTLLSLLAKGAIHVMKVDDWKVDGFVFRQYVDGKRGKFKLIVDDRERSLRFIIMLVEQGVLASNVVDGKTFYSLAPGVQEEFKDADSRVEMGFGDHIVLSFCYPAHKWARKQGKSSRGFW